MCVYFPKSAEAEHGRPTAALWDAIKFAKAVKRKEINGYLTYPFRNGTTERISAANIARARQIFGNFISITLEKIGGNHAPLIPLPSKDGLVGSTSFRSLQMLIEAKGDRRNWKIEPIVRFSEPLKPASEGGPRGRDRLKPYMRIIGQPSVKSVILIDDIFTTGGTILAAYDILKEIGIETVAAIVCAHTNRDTSSPPFGVQVSKLDTRTATEIFLEKL